MHKTAVVYTLDSRQRPVGWHVEEVGNPPTYTAEAASLLLPSARSPYSRHTHVYPTHTTIQSRTAPHVHADGQAYKARYKSLRFLPHSSTGPSDPSWTLRVRHCSRVRQEGQGETSLSLRQAVPPTPPPSICRASPLVVFLRFHEVSSCLLSLLFSPKPCVCFFWRCSSGSLFIRKMEGLSLGGRKGRLAEIAAGVVCGVSLLLASALSITLLD